MYAVVNIAGQQFKVEKDQKIYVHRLSEKEGDKVTFDEVLLLDNKGKVDVGAPVVKGAQVTAKILKHLKGDKVIVFKKKRRKGYQTRNGHRQLLSQIAIEGISVGGAKSKSASSTKPAEEKKETKPKAESAKPKAEADKPKAKKEVAKPKAEKKQDISENLVTRAENRVDDSKIQVNVDKLLHHIGTAVKADKQDLTKISGIGPVFEEKLNTIGIYTYEQISKLKAGDKENLSKLSGITADKINEDEWVKQSKELMKESK